MVMAKISTISNTSFGTYHIAKYVDSLYQLHPLLGAGSKAKYETVAVSVRN